MWLRASVFRVANTRHTVLYGHVIQLQHAESMQYLTSQGPVEGNRDGGLALRLGLTPDCDAQSRTWFRVRPATEQRSDGEKVWAREGSY